MNLKNKNYSVDIFMFAILIIIAIFFGIFGIAIWSFVHGCYLLFKGAISLKGDKKGLIRSDFIIIAIFILVAVIAAIIYFLEII